MYLRMHLCVATFYKSEMSHFLFKIFWRFFQNAEIPRLTVSQYSRLRLSGREMNRKIVRTFVSYFHLNQAL